MRTDQLRTCNFAPDDITCRVRSPSAHWMAVWHSAHALVFDLNGNGCFCRSGDGKLKYASALVLSMIATWSSNVTQPHLDACSHGMERLGASVKLKV